MSHSSSPSESPSEESGHISSQSRRASTSDNYDPSEHSYSGSELSPSRSSSLVSAPPQSASRARVRTTARISIPAPVRETFIIPSRDEAGPSRLRVRRDAPSPSQVARTAGQPTGMSALESFWVSGLSRELEISKTRLDHYGQSLDKVIGMLHTQDQTMNGVMIMLAESRRVIQRLYAGLALVLGALIVIMGWFVLFYVH
ncbi:hypothetical protein L6452_27698 [Arctium lappa]|uniref:Uncharacterized protein n=1 Tax=Arctium lappa TaxID=4217 RepID=A0ACB8ZWI2_ARCLA|nr:hypothetical protein L6452_27698 [Arctium lappa]